MPDPANIKTIFLAAADKPPAQRAAYLAQACGGDGDLRRRIEALLKAHDDTGGWLGEPATPTSDYPGFAAPSVEELAPLFPQLEILELLGRGGMGAVYKARQKNLDRLVALKILPHDSGDAGFAERFTREARTLAKLNHPGIVAVHDFGTANGLYWFVMEFVDGVNLRQAKKAGTLTPAVALAIVPKICEALQFAHDAGVVHRDIKPENVLLDSKGRVKIADFGLAKLIDPERSHLTGTHQAMGTPHYMAPEQWERPLEVDHRADIYSLGVVFYELLTGELPLGRFAPPSQKVQIDVRLDEVVLRTLEKEPERRYQQASEVKTDVERIGQSDSAPRVIQEMQAPPPALVPTPPTPFLRGVVAPCAVLGMIAVLIAIGISRFYQGPVKYRDDLIAAAIVVGFYGALILFAVLALRWFARRRQQSILRTLADAAGFLRLNSLTNWAIVLCAFGAANVWLPWFTETKYGQWYSLRSFAATKDWWTVLLAVCLAFLIAGFLLFATGSVKKLRPLRIVVMLAAALFTLVLALFFILDLPRSILGAITPPAFVSLGLSAALFLIGAFDLRSWVATANEVRAIYVAAPIARPRVYGGESTVEKSAAICLLAAFAAHFLQWGDLIVKTGSFQAGAFPSGITFWWSGVPSGSLVACAAIFLGIASLSRFSVSQRQMLRGLSILFALVGLGYQIFLLVVGLGRVVESSVAFEPRWGLYGSAGLTVVGIILALLAMLDGRESSGAVR